MFFCLTFSLNAEAKEYLYNKVVKNDITITLNGDKTEYKGVILDSNVYLPVRALAYTLNAKLDYNSKYRTINITTSNILVNYNKNSISKKIDGNKSIYNIENMNIYINGKILEKLKNEIIIIDSQEFLNYRES